MPRQAESIRTRIRRLSRSRFALSLFATIAPLIAATPSYATAQDGRETSMADVRMHFARCIVQPQNADGTLVTFYFSLKSDGEIFGDPRIILFGYRGSDDVRQTITSALRDSFDRCVPLPLGGDFARTIPGKVYFLQFRFGAQGSPKTEVKFRPYGSGLPIDAIDRQR
jgi:hypothetical protein